ncbi:uncharacterized protein BO80DRAFT_194284 [Aspergillus ibericus CBS 121593]|uniref:Uncharacterized protein n=1 Tax=Aspergillus ibericus CBS 121593 TaxID=1448316 RepID=A0A395GPB9_9EURO|nr:hypothetical protein BO80DRAFT_194284 [Aspergillus ibericus CBS 121593]RAK97351.1 hypothetical protein BO80DRAFT_194284 [Aspergillus ibericus CBS 121593]
MSAAGNGELHHVRSLACKRPVIARSNLPHHVMGLHPKVGRSELDRIKQSRIPHPVSPRLGSSQIQFRGH